MATPTLVTVRDYTTSRYSQMAENTEGQLTDILARAETAIQSFIGRNLLEQAYIERFRAKSQTLFVRNRPITGITSIRRRVNPLTSWQTVNLDYVSINDAPAGYIECFPAFGGIVAGYEVEVTYTAGYETLPEDLKEAIIMQAVLFSYQDLEVYGSGDSKKPGITYFWDDIARIVDRYRTNGTVYH